EGTICKVSATATAKDPIKAEHSSWSKPIVPWDPVHADFAGPIDETCYIVIVDAYSKWPGIIQISSVPTSATTSALKKIFVQFGNPQTLVTNNGMQFTSTAFKEFCRARGITHLRPPPFHPQSNGQVERFVDIFKCALIKLKGEEPTTDALQTFLMAYRSTLCPSGADRVSPAENFMGCRLRTIFEQIITTADSVVGPRESKMEKQFNRHHDARRRHSEVGDAIYAKDYRGPKSTWMSGTIVRKTGNATYTVRRRK
ncbi:Uncharacterized protein K02A2.6, partial [Toxocara canis]